MRELQRNGYGIIMLVVILLGPTSVAEEDQFHAVGSREPVVEYLEQPSSPVPKELRRVAVEVQFDLLPTMMRFSMPCYPSMVTENDIHYSNGWTETYDPNASSSCEVLWDKEAQYARMWIEHESPARIVVRARAAITDPDGYIGHSNIPSVSPYGPGDWTDEWYYIYPDGVHTRHVRIYTGLAAQSLLVTDFTFTDVRPTREIPPAVVHEFQEHFIFGLDGRLPTDDIETAPLTFTFPDGRSKTISYQPYPERLGEFLKAPIMVVNTKSKYRPFTVFIPFGLEQEPYPPEGELPHVFQTWGGGEKGGYSTSLGHGLNWWHFRRTDMILEQVYLSGMIPADTPKDTLIAMAQSWLRAPQVVMDGIEPRYKVHRYDQTQRAYVFDCGDGGPSTFDFTLGKAVEGDPRPYIENPAVVLKRWGRSDAVVTLNGNAVERGRDYRIGYEEDDGFTNLVVWFPLSSNDPVRITVKPRN